MPDWSASRSSRGCAFTSSIQGRDVGHAAISVRVREPALLRSPHDRRDNLVCETEHVDGRQDIAACQRQRMREQVPQLTEVMSHLLLVSTDEPLLTSPVDQRLKR